MVVSQLSSLALLRSVFLFRRVWNPVVFVIITNVSVSFDCTNDVIVTCSVSALSNSDVSIAQALRHNANLSEAYAGESYGDESPLAIRKRN